MEIVYKTVYCQFKQKFIFHVTIISFKPRIAFSFSSPRSNYAASTSATQTTDPTARD